MPVDKTLIALGMLFTLGAAGGFVLSAKMSPAAIDSITQRQAEAGGEGQGGAVPGKGSKRGGPTQKRSDGGAGGSEGKSAAKGKEGKERPGAEGAETADEAGAGGAKAAAAAEAKPSGQGKRDDGNRSAAAGSAPAEAPRAEADASPPCASAEITGLEAAAFLSGNTVSGTPEDGRPAEITYFAPRGWIARIHSGSMVIKAWDVDGATLCDPDPRSPALTVCETLRARKCLDPDQDGFRIGALRVQSGRWMPVLRGNLQHFPPYIPYFDPQPSTPAEGRPGGLPEGRRPRKAKDLFATDAVYRYASRDSADRDRIVVFEDSGRRLDFTVPTVEEATNGATVDVSRWDRKRDTLCGGGPAAEARPKCWTMVGTREGHLLLKSGPGAADFDLTAVRNAPSVMPTDDVRSALPPRPGDAKPRSAADRRPAVPR